MSAHPAQRGTVREHSAEVRRIVEDLRPPVLDELGLLQALHVRAGRTERRSDGSTLTAVVQAPPSCRCSPAAVEVAAYRIVAEALTNAVRHSSATSVVVRLECDEELRVEVLDDGRGDGAWRPEWGSPACARGWPSWVGAARSVPVRTAAACG